MKGLAKRIWRVDQRELQQYPATLKRILKDSQMSIDRKTLDVMQAAGITFVANVEIPSGSHTIFLTPEHVDQFIANKNAAAAKYFGVAESDYRNWIDDHGLVQCSATTKTGSRCKNVISGGGFDNPTDWKKRQGEYCAVHGGPDSEVK